jgi:hypothetical protein
MFDTKLTLIHQLRPRGTFLDPDAIPSTKTSLLRRFHHTIKSHQLPKAFTKTTATTSKREPFEIKQTAMARGWKPTSQRRQRRATYPGSTGRQFGQARLASAVESHRLLYTLCTDQPPLIHRDDRPSGGDFHSTDLDELLPPFASLFRDQTNEEEEKDEHEHEEREQKEHGYQGKGKGKEKEEAVAPHTERALRSAFRALQFPATISHAEFTHFAIQFVFEVYTNLPRFQDTGDVDYDEDALAASFSHDFAAALWGDDAPQGDDAIAWLKNLTHFFAVLRRGPYMRGGSTATLRELLVGLVGEESVAAGENPPDHHVHRWVDQWIDYPSDPAETELIRAHRELWLTEVHEGRVVDFVDFAAAWAFERYVPLDNESADLQGLGDLYGAEELAGEFYTSFRIALWDGVNDTDDVYDARMGCLRRFFSALQAKNYPRNRVGASRDCLVRLVGLEMVNFIEHPEGHFTDVDPNETTGSNPILSVLFANLDISQDLPRDRPMLDGFQHAVTNIAFQTINASRRGNESSHALFGPDAHVSPDNITRIIGGVLDRYATKLWPQVVGVSSLPYWLPKALEAYILALIKVPAMKAPRDGEDTLRVFDNILGLNQGDLEEGLPNLDTEKGDEGEDDGLECVLKELGADESCSKSFATVADLASHLVEVHDMDPQGVRDDVQEAEVALRKRRGARRS